jgi:hypothetical protein
LRIEACCELNERVEQAYLPVKSNDKKNKSNNKEKRKKRKENNQRANSNNTNEK